MAELIYVHPVFHQSPNAIPMGIAGLLNALDCAKLGLFSNEVTEAQIRAARVVALDLHWFYPLDSVPRLAAAYKRVNPELKVIVGGYTAQVYADLLVRSAVDYVVRGDADLPFRRLVGALLGGGDVEGIPNLTARDFSTPLEFQIDSRRFSELDFASFDWFPTRVRQMRAARHQRLTALSKIDNTVFPWIPAFRGCPYPCEYCFGSLEDTRNLFGRSYVARSPGSIARDLDRCSDDPDVPGVAMATDFTDFLPEKDRYIEEVLSRRRNLRIYYEFFNPPPVAVVERFCESFDECLLSVALYHTHGESDRMVDLAHLEQIARCVARYPTADLYIFNPRTYYRYPSVFEVDSLAQVMSNEAWHIRVPDRRASDPETLTADFQHFAEETAGFFGRTAAANTAEAVSGLFPPEQQAYILELDHRLEKKEAGRQRGCVPRAVLDARYARLERAEEREAHAAWLKRFTSSQSRHVSIHGPRELTPTQRAERLAGTVRLDYSPGTLERLTASPLHLGFTAELINAEGLGDAVLPRCEPTRAGWEIVIADGLGTLGSPETLQTAQADGVCSAVVSERRHLLDGCRWGAARCPALALERAVIDGEGHIRACVAGRPLGAPGDSHQSLAAAVREDDQRTRAARGCDECPARSHCPKCIYLGAIPDAEYCGLFRRFPALSDIVLVPHIVTQMIRQGALPRPEDPELTYEVSDGHRLLDRIFAAEWGGTCSAQPRRVLRSTARVCQLDRKTFLCDRQAWTIAEIDESLLLICGIVRHGDGSVLDLARTLERHELSLDVGDLLEVLGEVGVYLGIEASD